MVPIAQEVTGERLLPDEQRGELVHAEHLARYRFARALARDRRVLDAASGEGYGASLLQRAGARSVVGVDIDPEAVDAARAKYGLDFRVADVAELPFADASFDLVTSFETIEHLSDAPRAVAELRRVLAEAGVLVISTPNVDEYLVDNPFHERELTPAEFRDLLTAHFEPVSFLYQQNWLASLVLGAEQLAREEPNDGPLDVDLTKVAGRAPGGELYTIAVCGPVPSPLPEVGVLTAVYEAHRMAQDVVRAQRDLDAWIERSLDAERRLEETRALVDDLMGSASWRVTRPLRWAKARARRR
jgi:SAM-dependent methyltransferase